MSYLPELTIRLAGGVGGLPAKTRDLHAQFLLSAQQSDGGFGGREGGSDLYYTAFALRSLAILGRLERDNGQRCADFLRGRLSGRETIVDFLSLIYGASLIDSAAGINVFENAQPSWRDSVAESLESLRRDDGGYAKGPEGQASSTYHTFLVILCLQLIERPLPQAEKAVEFLMQQTAEEGGFREIRASKRAGTNPTAAAIGALKILDALGDETIDDTIDFLLDMQTDEGGLRANTRIPIADLLSTFTGLLTLQDLEAAEELDLRAVKRFARSMQADEGGFHGAVWDASQDVEYTFYGLGTLALLQDAEDKE